MSDFTADETATDVEFATASGDNPAGEIVVTARTRAGARARALAGLTLGMSAFMAVSAIPFTTVSAPGTV
ncbi:hypothetical protein [Kutzneria buriramensis]|jgi:hypothetical protein|uniref:Uncharacterized protein n=1 Tax=Kutzneria buriramensis TaxID=1045776 RepID=A0A3E0H011_9PSEU|nr:hypothetical protein [Kutzneria buriramensis]REH35145.1 hypothetical protein BCF44_1185 [Kutzneria buriramensis]